MPQNIIEAFSVSHAQILLPGQSFLDALISAYNEDTDVYGVNSASLEPDQGDYDNEGDDTIMSTWSWINKANVAVQAGYLSYPLISKLSGRPLDTIAARPAQNTEFTIKTTGATAGTFTLSYGGQTTAALPFNVTSAAVTAALTALATVGTGNVTSTGGPAPADIVVTFNGVFAGRALLPLTMDKANLTGAAAGAGVTQTKQGSPALKGGVSMDLWHEDSMNQPAMPMIVKMPSKLSTGEPADFVFGLNKVSFKPIAFDGPAYKDGLKVNYNGTALASTTDELGNPFPDGKKRYGKLLSIFR